CYACSRPPATRVAVAPGSSEWARSGVGRASGKMRRPGSMPNVPQISDAEWEVMKVVWERQPVTAAEVVERLGRERRWSPRTIRTMLNRLLAKRAIDYHPEGKRYLYRSR